MDPTTPPGAAFAIVRDVAASWHDYAGLRDIVGDGGAPGLILHAAGATDGGFRTIDVWADQVRWRAEQRRLDVVLSSLAVPPVPRHFHVRHLVVRLPGGDRFVISTEETLP
ncbi:MAG: hypothetical protein ABIR68_09465 [Ilumatobacteraceae bacterium]